MSANDGTADDRLEFDVDDVEIDENQAEVVVTLTRQDEGIEGYVDVREGVDFDPGDTEASPGMDVLRLAAEMVLVAAGYDEDEVQNFLDTAPRGPVQLTDADPY